MDSSRLQPSADDMDTASSDSAPEKLQELNLVSSVLALAVNNEYIFAGTSQGEIVVWSLDNFRHVRTIQAHKRSILCLFVSREDSQPCEYLFSSASEPIISVWDAKGPHFTRLYEIYTTHEVGDVFSVVYSPQRDSVYVGTQTQYIQWVKLSDAQRRVAPDSRMHPDRREHGFFDSLPLQAAGGGSSTPRRVEEHWSLIPRAQVTLEMDRTATRFFAHYGWVFCMLVAKGPTVLVDSDEEVLITGGGDGTIKLWRQMDGSDDLGDDGELVRGDIEEIATLGGDEDSIESVLSLAVDGSFLYAGRIQGTIELWDLDTKQKLRVFQAHTGHINTLAMSAGLLWSASNLGSVAAHSTIHFGLDGATDVAGALMNNVSQRYQSVGKWQAHQGKILASAIATRRGEGARPEQLYITGANDNKVNVWRVGSLGNKTEPNGTTIEEEEEDMMITSLRQFISHKTVSSRSEFTEDCHRGATFLGALFKRLGAQVQLLNTVSEDGNTNEEPLNPIVLAKFSGKSEPAEERTRILFYGHYDVVPAESPVVNSAPFQANNSSADATLVSPYSLYSFSAKATETDNRWRTDPFRMRGIDGYLYGRGVSDNKGPITAAIYAVADLLQAKALDSDIVFLIEGEEEAGSRGFQETVHRHKELIGHIDYVLLANSYWLDDEVPCLTYGLRGVLRATVCVESGLPDMHSGVDGTHLRSEPLGDLTQLMARLKTSDGGENMVALPGFYDGILPVTPEEDARYEEVAEMLKAKGRNRGRSLNQDQHGYGQLHVTSRDSTPNSASHEGDTHSPLASASTSFHSTLANASIAEIKRSLMARWREPTLTLHGYSVSGPNNSLISRHAAATLSMRLVPGQEAEQVGRSLEKLLRQEFAALQSDNTLMVLIDNKAEPWLGVPGNYIFRTLEEAVVKAWYRPGERKRTRAGTADREAVPAAGKSAARGMRPLYIREGGSIPAVRFLEKEFGAPAAHLPCGQASDAAHLYNERLRVVNLLKSREIFREVFRELKKGRE